MTATIPRTHSAAAVTIKRHWPAQILSAHPAHCRRHSKLAIRATLVAVLIGAITTEIVNFHSEAGDAAHALSHPNSIWLLIAVSAQFASMAAAARLQQRLLMAGGLRPTMRTMAPLTYAANAVSVTLPAGTAISTGYTYRRLRGLGASAPLATFTLVAGGALSTLGFGVLSLGALAAHGTARTGSILLAIVILALIAGTLCLRRLRGSLGLINAANHTLTVVNRVLRRPRDRNRVRLTEIIEDIRKIRPRRRDWAAGVTFALLNWTADLACFVAASHAIGAREATLSLVVIAYVAGMSLAGISLLPGGLGLVDAAMILALSHGGVGPITATAAVLLYRTVSYVLVALIGWAAWTIHWNRARQEENSAPRRGRIPARAARSSTTGRSASNGTLIGTGERRCRAAARVALVKQHHSPTASDNAWSSRPCWARRSGRTTTSLWSLTSVPVTPSWGCWPSASRPHTPRSRSPTPAITYAQLTTQVDRGSSFHHHGTDFIRATRQTRRHPAARGAAGPELCDLELRSPVRNRPYAGVTVGELKRSVSSEWGRPSAVDARCIRPSPNVLVPGAHGPT